MSLLVSGIRPVIDFGYMMTAGIAMALAVIFVLFPAAMVLLPRARGEERDFTRGVTLAFARLTERPPQADFWEWRWRWPSSVPWA